MEQADQRIIIVGAGPTGATLALLLARRGLASTLIERRPEPQSHPAASVLNTRTMEIFRELGLEPEIMSDCQEVFHRSNITWVTSLAGRQLGQLFAVQEDLEQQLALSPTHAVHYPQHRLEPRLWNQLKQNPSIELCTGARCLEAWQDGSRVSARIENLQTGQRSTVTAAYLVACDGAESDLRAHCGIDFPGPVLQQMIGVHFEADLASLVDHRRSILYWVFNPEVLGVLIAHWLPTEWVLFFPYFPPQQSLAQFDEATIRKKIIAAVGTADLPGLKVHRTLPWQMTSRIASRFRQGRVFFAGDAAHTFPPTGGLGLNTGVQDAHNLAWKLAAVLRQDADASLLQTYEDERRPVAAANLRHSTDNYWKMNEMIQVVGIDFRHLERLRKLQKSRVFQVLPRVVQRRALDGALHFVMNRLRRLDDASEESARLRQRFADCIPDQVAHYRFLGLDLGFTYRHGAILAEHVRDERRHEKRAEPQLERRPRPFCTDDVTRYEPSLRCGGRLPHVWIDYDGQAMSTLDLVPQRGNVLLTNLAHRAAWDRAIALGHVPSRIMAQPPCLAIDADTPADAIDRSGQWRQLLGDDCCGVLVRPDGHIAWLPTCVPGDPLPALAKFMSVESQPA